MPTWRDTNPVPGDGTLDTGIQTESRRGGGSQPTQRPAPATRQRRRLPLWAWFIIGILAMAYLAGIGQVEQSKRETVPTSWVDPNFCFPNGPILYVDRFVHNPAVLYVHCAVPGITLTTATPAGH